MQEQRRGRKIAMTSEDLDEYLATERTCTVATVSHDGPHVTALWFVWDGACIWLYSITRSQRWADLQRDPRVALLVEAGEEYFELRGVEISGRVETVGEIPRTGEANDELLEAERLFAAKYQAKNDGAGADAMFHDGRHAWLKLTPAKIASWDFRKMNA
jgi:nitroimidazol reductase NimA-like FMN-containing flavoprotein (pyridoxamine 5'-phosphate oxidase superfamily)